MIFVKGPSSPSLPPSFPLSLDPNDSPVPFMLVDVDGGGGDGIETKPITSLDGRSRRRHLCFVIYPIGWSGGEGSGVGCVKEYIRICAPVAESCKGEK